MKRKSADPARPVFAVVGLPVLLLASGVAPSRHAEALDQRRVASTLATLLRVPPPLPSAPPALPGVTGYGPN